MIGLFEVCQGPEVESIAVDVHSARQTVRVDSRDAALLEEIYDGCGAYTAREVARDVEACYIDVEIGKLGSVGTVELVFLSAIRPLSHIKAIRANTTKLACPLTFPPSCLVDDVDHKSISLLDCPIAAKTLYFLHAVEAVKNRLIVSVYLHPQRIVILGDERPDSSCWRQWLGWRIWYCQATHRCIECHWLWDGRLILLMKRRLRNE